MASAGCESRIGSNRVRGNRIGNSPMETIEMINRLDRPKSSAIRLEYREYIKNIDGEATETELISETI